MNSLTSRISNILSDRHSIVIGLLVSFVLIGVLVLFSSSHVLATGESAARSGIPYWISQLEQNDLTSLRQTAQQRLEQAGPAAIDQLLASLSSANPVLRRNSAEMLGYIGAPSTAPALRASLESDVDPSVRRQAALSLAQLNVPEAAVWLERATLFDQDMNVRRAADDSLESMRQQFAVLADRDIRHISAFAVPPIRPNTIYLADIDTLVVSHDGGKTWAPMGRLPSRVVALAVNPQNADGLYAGTEAAGFFRSADGGATWTAMNSGLGLEPGVSLTVTAITSDPHDPERLFAATGFWVGTSQRRLLPQGVFSSSDGGLTWQQIPAPMTENEIKHLAIRGNDLYALAGDQVMVIPL